MPEGMQPDQDHMFIQFLRNALRGKEPLRRMVTYAAVFSLVAGPNCAHAQSPGVAIRGVTVVDVRDGSLHPEHTVLVTGNRIAAVGPARKVAVPADAEIVEGAGRYLIPGLWDMHVHSVSNVAVDRSNQTIAAQDWHFSLFLAHGVTGVRNMNDGTGDVMLAVTKSVRRRLAAGELRGPPRFLTAGPSVDGDPPLGSNPVVVRTAAEARAAVQQLASNGADLIKVYENLSREGVPIPRRSVCGGRHSR